MMKLYINHTYSYLSQHITMLFFSRVKVIAIDTLPTKTDDLIVVSEQYINKNQIKTVAKIITFGNTLAKNVQTIPYSKDIKNYKYAVAITLFNSLSEYTGKRPQWGILTGVRPTKRYHALRANGMTTQMVRDHFKHHDLVSPEKIDLLQMISEQSYSHIFPVDDHKISLYIGIPFCPSKCVYCSFTTCIKEKGDQEIERYVGALICDIKQGSAAYKKKIIQTIYIGGGTPAMLTNDQIVRIYKALTDYYNLSKLQEFTFEAGRPELMSDSLLKTLDHIGVTRICINPQTMHDDTLKTIGRTHSALAIKKAFDQAKNYKFILNADVIAGLMNQSIDQSIASLRQILDLNPHNITLHTLSLKKGSILYNAIDDYTLMAENDVAEVVTRSHQMLLDAGYLPYYMYRQKYISGNLENVGYTKAGFESIYNIQIIEEKQTIIAFGAGTTRKIYNEDGSLSRAHKTKNIKEYIDENSPIYK